MTGDIKYKYQVTLDYPNIATDEFNNKGTWTLIYNQVLFFELTSFNVMFEFKRMF